MIHRRVLDVDRADPLTPGLDEVLDPVGDLYVALWVDRSDVAGREPAVLREPRFIVLEVAVDNPRAQDLELSECDAVVRGAISFLVHDADLDPKRRTPFLRLEEPALLERQLAMSRRERVDGA